MKVSEIYEFLDKLSPFDAQEEWDNSGLNLGSFDDEFDKIYISLDLDLDLVQDLSSNSLVLLHHPLIFKPLKSINYDSYSTKILRELIRKNISLIALHTNFDLSHLNAHVLNEILGLKVYKKDDFLLYAKLDKENQDFDIFYKKVSKDLQLEQSPFVKCKEKIKNIAFCTGAGMSLLSKVQADCFLTGDIKYHEAMEAKARGISLIDIKHFESEKYFSPLLFALLEKYLKKNKLKAIMTNSENPFTYKI